MRLLRLHLQAFGPFTDRWLDFGDGSVGLHLVCGMNEAGKSSTLRALTALRHGIEMRSTDDFVHDHPAMRLGAVLRDRDGRPVHVVRRKGRGQTLSVRIDAHTSVPADADLEHQLTGGLQRADHEALYGLDHARLRQGGEALLKGQGDVGAALFEASAGVRSLQEVLARFDQEARRHFVPGARGTRGRINEALRQHGEQATLLRAATLRPTAWVDLQRRCEEHAQALQTLLQRQQGLDRAVRLGQERLSVAPLLARLDQATARCAALADAPVLDEDAAARRLTLQARLAEHQQALRAVQDALERHRLALQALPPGGATVLQAAPAIERLVAQAEQLDQGRRAVRDAEAEQARLQQELHRLLAAIDPARAPEALLPLVPSVLLKARADAALQSLEEADRALRQHRQAMLASAEAAAAPVSADADAGAAASASVRPAADPVRSALRAACDAVVRADAPLARLAALPAEHAQARQRLAAALADLGGAMSWSVAAVRAACPVLEVDIDQAVRAEDDGRTRQAELLHRLTQIEEAHRRKAVECDRLLAQGVVPTPDDVQVARQGRDLALRDWAADPADASARQRAEQAVRQADALVDVLVRDVGRAVQIQALQREIADLVRDRDLLQAGVRQLQQAQAARSAAWLERLHAAGLPPCPPESLREWQARLRVARAAADQAEALQQEEARATAVAEQLRQDLRQAWRAAAPAAESDAALPLATLLVLARQCEERFSQVEQAARTRAAEQAAREAQHARERREEARLVDLRAAAAHALEPLCVALLLPAEADAVSVRARLREWDEVRLSAERLAQACAAHDAARRTVADLVQRAAELAQALHEPLPEAALRHWIDDLARRLDDARRLEQQRQSLAQAVAEADARRQQHLGALEQAGLDLQALCMAAGVEGVADLPAAEEHARLRRQALQERDHVRDLLAQVSVRDEAALRALVGEFDAAQAQAELQQAEQALADLAPQVDEARRQDEAARRARDAIDSGDAAAQARAGVEQAASTIRASMAPWLRARLAQALLAQALGQFRERAQGPMLRAASGYFATMTGGAYARLQSEPGDGDQPVLQVHRQDGRTLGVDGLSEGTRDQLYLALRLAALELHRARGIDLPLVLDDVLMTSDDERALHMLRTLAAFAQGAQVLVFTHHRHLLELARRHLPATVLSCSTL